MPLEKMFPYPENFVVEFEDGAKVNVASKECNVHMGTKAETVAQKACWKLNKRVPYKDRDTLFPVRICKLEIDDGKLATTHFQTLKIRLPHEEMTQEEFNKQIEYTLCSVPAAYYSFVYSEAWERGHSAGYSEVVSIAENLVEKLLPCVARHTLNVQSRD